MQPHLLLLALATTGLDAELAPSEAEPPWGAIWAQLQASAGPEIDTNARRSVSGDASTVFGPGRGEGEVTDGLLRMLLDAQANLRIGARHQVYAGYVLGAKRFLTEDSEDLLTHTLSLESQHELGSTFDVGLSGWLRSSRMRSERRDYDLGIVTVRAGARVSEQVRVEVGADLRAFGFDIQPKFDFWGPQAFVRVRWRPTSALSFFVRGALAHRRYAGFALVTGTRELADGQVEELPVFCDGDPAEVAFDCEPAGPRRDFEGQVQVGGRLRAGPLLLRGGYLVRLQRSTGVIQDIDRHRIFAQVTWALPVWRLTTNLMAALQLNNGLSDVSQQTIVAEDDENQNSVRLQLRRPLGAHVDAELHYALFANQFGSADVRFLRQTVSLGVRVHFDGSRKL